MADNATTIQVREVGRRDWRLIALMQIVCVGVISAGFVVLVLIVWNEFTSAPTIGADELLMMLGSGARDVVMGALGVVATVQLACFIAIVTGQIVHQDGAEESKLRSMLSVISLVAVVSVGPAILAVSFHSAHSREDSGLLLVVIPIYSLQLAISTVIGTFEVGDDETLLGFAQERKKRAMEQIVRLERWPTASAWRAVLAVGVMLVAAMVLSGPVAAVLSRWYVIPPLGDAVPATFALGTGVAVGVLGLVVTDSQLKRSAGAVDVISAVIIHITVGSYFVFVFLLAWFNFWPLAVPMAVMACVLILLAITSIPEAHHIRVGLKPRRVPIPVLGAIGRLGTRDALRSARKEQADAQKHVDKYSAKVAEREAKRASTDPAPSATAELPSADPSIAAPRRSRLSRALAEFVN
ncbi:hypothetical protein [Brachybacterium sp. GCM10030252]|uniref:hypothetical protein n=1 Tax=Brachybacterium sp. GCM10030252 TaxID=3273380 RepID=UPI00361B803B